MKVININTTSTRGLGFRHTKYSSAAGNILNAIETEELFYERFMRTVNVRYGSKSRLSAGIKNDRPQKLLRDVGEYLLQ